jgi:hypothetical protein
MHRLWSIKHVWENNARISGTHSLRMKTYTRVLLAVFYSSTETVLFIYKWKSCYMWNTSQWAPPAVLYTSCPDGLCDICNCCNDPCFEFIQHIHALTAHLVFHIAPKKNSTSIKSGEQGGNSYSNTRTQCKQKEQVHCPVEEITVAKLQTSIIFQHA